MATVITGGCDMSFFKDFKEDLAQAVNELVQDPDTKEDEVTMPDDTDDSVINDSVDDAIDLDALDSIMAAAAEADDSDTTEESDLTDEPDVTAEDYTDIVPDDVITAEDYTTEDNIQTEENETEDDIDFDSIADLGIFNMDNDENEKESDENGTVDDSIIEGLNDLDFLDEPDVDISDITADEPNIVNDTEDESKDTDSVIIDNVAEDIDVSAAEYADELKDDSIDTKTEDILADSADNIVEENSYEFTEDDSKNDNILTETTDDNIELPQEEFVEEVSDEEALQQTEEVSNEEILQQTEEVSNEEALQQTEEVSNEEILQQTEETISLVEEEHLTPVKDSIEVTEAEAELDKKLTEDYGKISEEDKRMSEAMETEIGQERTEEAAVFTAGVRIKGDVESTGSVEVIGEIEGNITCLGKLVVSGKVTGDSQAEEVYANKATIEGNIESSGAVKIGAGTVIVGNIKGTSAVIAGAIKGDIDVHGPVIVDTSAVVMGNIKSRSVQINSGAVIEGFCSQCYSDINVKDFFGDKKAE